MASTPTASPVAASQARLPLATIILTSVYAFGVNVVWLGYNSILLPVQIKALVPAAAATTVLGASIAVATLIGVVVNIVAGIYSDHSRSRWGRRFPVLVWGAVGTAPFLGIAALFPRALPLVLLAYLGMQVMTNISSAAFLPTLADFIPERQRGVSSGWKGVFTLIGSAVAFGVVTALTEGGDTRASFALLAAIFVTTTLINAFAMRPLDAPQPGTERLRLGPALRAVLAFRGQGATRAAPGFFAFVAGSFFIYMGVSALQFFGLFYFVTIFHDSQDQALRAVQVSGLINLTVSMAAALLAGWVSDRVGRRNLIIGSVVLAAGLSLAFPFVRSFPVFLLLAAPYSAFSGLIFSVDTALASDLVPPAAAGKYMAYVNLATGVANAIAPAIFGVILNLQGAPTQFSFVVFFAVTAVFYLVSSAILATRVPNR